MAWDIPANDIVEYYINRTAQYRTEVETLRSLTKGEEGFLTGGQKASIQLQELLLMLAEDNIVTTQVSLESYRSISDKTKVFRDFLDSQRFIIKIMFDFYNKSY
jgi:hypothetical protein